MTTVLVYAKRRPGARVICGILRRSIFLALAAAALAACGSSSPADPEPQNTCTTLLDCQAGYDCVDGHCYLKSDGDGEGQGCQSTLDCGNNEYCDPVWKKCRSLPADLDESDTDSDSDGTIEHDDEAVTPDGDPDADTEDSSPEVDQDTALLVSFSQPPSGAVVDGQVALTLLIQGPKSPDSVQLFAGTTLLTEWTAPPYTYLWDCNSSAEGPLTLRAVAHLNGTEFTGLLDLVLDHSAPTLQITSPAANGEEWSCEHEGTLKLTAGDHLRKLVVTVDGSVLSTLDSFGADPAFSFDLPASAKTPGNHTVSVRAEDLLGHAAANASSSYHIDDTPPKLVIQGPTFDPSAPKNGTIHVSQPLSITVEDASALKSVFITLRDSQFHTLKNISSAAELPYTLTDYDSILYNPDPASGNAIYPLDLTLLATVQDSCGNTYTTSDTEPYQIQVNRLAWSFDLTQHDPLFVPDGSYNQSTGAAIDHRGNITVGLFDHLIGLTPQGALRFNCTLRDGMDQLTTAATTPVIAQGEPGSDLPPLILVLANDGALWLRVDDPSLDGCLRLPSDALTTDLAPPSVEAPQAIDGGVTYTFVLCGQNKAARTNSRCQRLTLTHLFLPGVGQERDSLSVIWQRDYLNFSPPTSPLLPATLPTMMIGSQGKRILTLARSNGLEYNIDNRMSAAIQTLSPIPARNAIIAVGASELEIASELNMSSLRGNISNNVGNQVVSDKVGTFFVSQTSGAKGFLQSYVLGKATDTDPYGLYNYWSFTLEGAMGGTPAVGDNDTLYVSGANANGNIWALSIYPQGDPGPRPDPGTAAKLFWRTRLQTGLLAPLTVSPDNTLIVVGKDFIVRALTLNPVTKQSQSGWSMWGGGAAHSSRY